MNTVFMKYDKETGQILGFRKDFEPEIVPPKETSFEDTTGTIVTSGLEMTPSIQESHAETSTEGTLEITEEVWTKIRMNRGKHEDITIDTIRAADVADVVSNYDDIMIEHPHAILEPSKMTLVKEAHKGKAMSSLTVGQKWDLVEAMAIKMGLLDRDETSALSTKPDPAVGSKEIVQ